MIRLFSLDTRTPDGPWILWNWFIDFAVEHQSGCSATEPGWDIEAIEIWSIDVQLISFNSVYCLCHNIQCCHRKLTHSAVVQKQSNFQPFGHSAMLTLNNVLTTAEPVILTDTKDADVMSHCKNHGKTNKKYARKQNQRDVKLELLKN